MPTDKQAQEYAFASADRAKQTADKHWQKIVDAHKEEIARLKETIKNLEEKNLR